MNRDCGRGLPPTLPVFRYFGHDTFVTGMHTPAQWTPMSWPCGPLEIARTKDAAAETREALQALVQPSALRILENSPVNCIVVSWAAGLPEDAEQQRALQPLIEAARRRGLDVLGRVWGSPGRLAGTGLAAIVAEKPVESDVPVILAAAPGDVARDAVVAAVAHTVWPRVPVRKGGSAEARPTGPPWVDANGWRALLANAKAPKAPVWIFADPPRDLVLLPDAYALAVADSGAYGARWVVSLDPGARLGLSKGIPAAAEIWSTLRKALEYFGRPAPAPPYRPQLAIVSDFAGPNQFLAQEVLNLATRRHLAYKIVDRAQMNAADLQGIRSALLVDRRLPDHVLMNYAQNGGTLIVPSGLADAVAGLTLAQSQNDAFRVYAAGKGQIAVATKPWVDPYLLAADVHLLISRRNDPFRLWNASSTHVHVTAGTSEPPTAHVVNYTSRRFAHPMSLWVAGEYKSARIATMFGEPAKPLPVLHNNAGTEVHLPPFEICATIEFEGGSRR